MANIVLHHVYNDYDSNCIVYLLFNPQHMVLTCAFPTVLVRGIEGTLREVNHIFLLGIPGVKLLTKVAISLIIHEYTECQFIFMSITELHYECECRKSWIYCLKLVQGVPMHDIYMTC